MSMFDQLRDLESSFDAQAAIKWSVDHDEIPIFAITLYLAAIFWIPPKLVGTTPLKLRRTWALWNALLAVFSMFGASRTLPTLYTALRMHGFRFTTCTDSIDWYLGVNERPCGMWMTLFIFSKIPELIDTIFLVIQQKEVIFLHWFHHITVLLYCWHAYTSSPAATGLWFAAMNFTVHSVMYTYYFFSISGMRKLARPLAPAITILQIAQMAVGCGVTVYAAGEHYTWAGAIARGESILPPTCAGTPESYKLGLGMYSSYLLLFSALFYANYLAPGAKNEIECGCSVLKKSKKDVERTVMVCGVRTSPSAPFGDGAFAGGGGTNTGAEHVVGKSAENSEVIKRDDGSNSGSALSPKPTSRMSTPTNRKKVA